MEKKQLYLLRESDYVNKEEIFRYIELGKSKSICVDRRLLDQYPGIIRNIIIKSGEMLQIDYLDKHILELGEGEISLYFYYENYDKLFLSVENLTGTKMELWNNYTKSELYPDIGEFDLSQSWEKLKIDFVNKTLHLPKGYREKGIRDLYWKALDSGEIKVNDSMDIFKQWLKRKMIEEEEMYEE